MQQGEQCACATLIVTFYKLLSVSTPICNWGLNFSVPVIVRSVQETHISYDSCIIPAVVIDMDSPGEHQQGSKGDANAEDGHTEEANSEGEGEVPAVEALGAGVQRPVPMSPGCLQVGCKWGASGSSEPAAKYALTEDKAT